ncbi:MAG: phosphodiesterase [Rhodospirillales bacterium]|jgi:3',5'-cyclic AMP phosphodiesterase CpdA
MLIAQISDPHIKTPGKLAYNQVDTAAMLSACVRAINDLPTPPDLILMTGDLVDIGLPDEYAHLRSLLAPLSAPLLAVPGNHDMRDAMRAAFRDGGYLPDDGFLQFAIDSHPLRLIGLDTLVPGEGGGLLCEERLRWLDETLGRHPEAPTLLMMHHPPFKTGIGHMDRIGLNGREAFAEILSRHSQVQAVLCGHLHRTIHAQVGGRAVLTCPSPAHQVTLDLREQAPSCFRMEPPGFMLHLWQEGRLISHVASIGDYAGPFPFFGEDGRLIG